jgi:hypothetical protein
MSHFALDDQSAHLLSLISGTRGRHAAENKTQCPEARYVVVLASVVPGQRTRLSSSSLPPLFSCRRSRQRLAYSFAHTSSTGSFMDKINVFTISTGWQIVLLLQRIWLVASWHSGCRISCRHYRETPTTDEVLRFQNQVFKAASYPSASGFALARGQPS